MAIVLKAIENAANAAGQKMPARADVAKAVRALKDFPGITGTFTFNAKGDLAKAKYFIIQVTSADPANVVAEQDRQDPGYRPAAVIG
jgi:branched-chain amino acid transport system substrate-binding protein